MSVLWTISALDEPMHQWLNDLGVLFPLQPSRLPTGAEIKSALADFSGYDVKIADRGIGSAWEADIVDQRGAEHGWAFLRIIKFTGDDQPQELYFEKGSEPLMTALLSRLTPICGPLALIPDTGDLPTVIDS
jgi:hypothetical protein